MSVLQGTRDALDGYFKLIVVAPVFVYDAEGLEAFTVNGRLGFPLVFRTPPLPRPFRRDTLSWQRYVDSRS